jgi:Flp pilus assembly protein TadD
MSAIRTELEKFIDTGIKLAARGDTMGAESAFGKALELDPNEPSAHFNLGLLLSYAGRSEEADREYREAIRCDPSDAECCIN